MRVLIDTHVALALLRGAISKKYPGIAARLSDPSTNGFFSVVSLWEIAIKTRLGKLDTGMPLQDIVGYMEASGLAILPIEHGHVVQSLDPEPVTRDPFDRLLLAQCHAESLVLATVDRALIVHGLALKI